MSLNYVTLTVTAQDAAQDAGAGAVTVIPTSVVTASGVTVVSQDPVVRQLSGGTASVLLVASDNAGTSPAAGFWAYSIQVGSGKPQLYLVNFANGATQRLDNLTPVVASTTYGPAAGSGGFQNPMTTLGDTLYEDATPAAARLPGNVTATRKFLRQQGTGTVSAAPAWDTLQAGDIPDQAWQFRPESYGAKGDGKVVADVVTNGTTTITSATAAFTNADVGKRIMINGALGATSAPLVTTISSVTNSTTAVLAAAATASISNAVAVYGTDDTSAINSALSAAGTYAVSNGYFAEVVFGAKIYVLASGPTQTGNGTSTPTFNAQVPLPYPNANGTTRKLVIALTGAGDASFYQYWESTTPNLAGTVLASMLTSAPSTPDPTFGNQSVIGGPSGSAGFTGGFANVKPVVKGIEVVSPAYTNQYAFDFGYCSAMRVQQSSAHIFAPTGVNGGNSPLLKDLPAQAAFQGKIGAGLRAPVIGNNADVTADDFTVEGYSRGLYVSDHFTAGKISCLYNDVALKVDLTQGLSGVSHGVSIALLGAESYNGGISVTGGSAYVPLYINLDSENTSPAYDVSDASGVAYGIVHFADTNNRAPVVSGAGNLKVINDRLGPGPWSGAPAAPSSGSAQQNTAWRDATVYLSAATSITAVSVDSTALGLTAGANVPLAVRVPAGHSYTPTYTGALTTHWVLD